MYVFHIFTALYSHCLFVWWRRRGIWLRILIDNTEVQLTLSSGSEGATGVSGLSASAVWPFFLSPFLSFPFPVPGSPDLGRRGTNGMLSGK